MFLPSGCICSLSRSCFRAGGLGREHCAFFVGIFYFNGFQLFFCFKSPEAFKLQAFSNPVKHWESAT